MRCLDDGVEVGESVGVEVGGASMEEFVLIGEGWEEVSDLLGFGYIW